MPEPVTVDAYLVALNRELAVGLGRRRRILAEVEDHLRTAAAVAEAGGATPRQAQVLAISALGSPQELGPTFGTDLVGMVERTITPIADAADRFEARRPWLGKLARDWPPYAAVVVTVLSLGAARLLSGPYVLVLAAIQVVPWLGYPSRRRAPTDSPHVGLDLLPLSLFSLGSWYNINGPNLLWMFLIAMIPALAFRPARALASLAGRALRRWGEHWVDPLGWTLMTTLPILLLAVAPEMPYSVAALATLTALLTFLLAAGSAVGLSRQDRRRSPGASSPAA